MLQNPIPPAPGEVEAGSMSLLWPARANVCIPTTRCSASKTVWRGLLYRRILDLIWETLTVKERR